MPVRSSASAGYPYTALSADPVGVSRLPEAPPPIARLQMARASRTRSRANSIDVEDMVDKQSLRTAALESKAWPYEEAR